MLEMLCERLNKEGIGYKKVVLKDGTEFIYIHHGPFGRPEGMKIKNGEFRADFRISEDGYGLYTKVCGYTSYMDEEDIIRTIRIWG